MLNTIGVIGKGRGNSEDLHSKIWSYDQFEDSALTTAMLLVMNVDNIEVGRFLIAPSFSITNNHRNRFNK